VVNRRRLLDFWRARIPHGRGTAARRVGVSFEIRMARPAAGRRGVRSPPA